MDNRKSLSVAASRSDDPGQLEQMIGGLNAQAWGTLISLLVCVVGPLLFHGRFSFEAFGFVVAVGLSATAAFQLAVLHHTDRQVTVMQVDQPVRKRIACTLLMGLGGGAMVLPVALMRINPRSHTELVVAVCFLAGAGAWFVGECVKLRILEGCARGVPGMELVRRSRNLRWGASLATLLLALGALPSANHVRVPGMYVVMGSVSLLVLTLLSAWLYARVSRALQEQAAFARAVRQHLGIAQVRELPDEPDWLVTGK